MNNMNQNGMNNIGMNPFGMNQIGMNNFGINPMGLNPMAPNQMMMQNQQNFMNETNMDQTSQNIKNIIEPYENKIRELEETIRQKDFEIIVLKQKLNNNQPNVNFMNMNHRMMNMNNLNNNEDKGKEISVIIKTENNQNDRYVNCFENDKASILREKCNIKEGILTYDYKVISENLSIKDNGIYNKANIKLKNQTMKIYNVIFNASLEGNLYRITLDGDCPIEIAIFIYIFETNKICALFNGEFNFFFNASKLNIHDKTPIKQIFYDMINPTIIVDFKNRLIG